jgi:hypothetical protein
MSAPDVAHQWFLKHLFQLDWHTTDYALRVWDDELGIWLTLALANIQEEAMAQGIPVLRGPYVVDYTDIPHDGDKKVLWTPQVGDVILGLFPDYSTVTQWDQGQLFIGQNVDGVSIPAHNVLTNGSTGGIGKGNGFNLDFLIDATLGNNWDAGGATYGATGHVCHTADPVQIQLARSSGTDPTQGHVSLYALVARAVAP